MPKQEQVAAIQKPEPAEVAVVAPTAQPLTRSFDAAAHKPGETFRDCPTCPQMVALPTGSYKRGSEDGGSAEKPVRELSIAYHLAVGKFEVTFAEWDACVAAGGCTHKPGDEGWGRGKRPVINVSWNDAKQYVAWLSKKAGQPYRLLTEAEWEYAVRAGTTTVYSFGDTITKSQAQFSEGNWGSAKQTVETGTFLANAFGLHDMHGNVWEWVEDCYADSYAKAPTDGSKAPDTSGCSRVLRGGSWDDNPQILRAAGRIRYLPDGRYGDIGFRLARTLNPTP